ncbi:MAG: isoprenylcysteine carboxylmethyltransferase family protein [Anaerolineales bacterium]|nr:isoprenylcysteine carboxylmethyltransferase family protein [Anaerolineales bacterium]
MDNNQLTKAIYSRFLISFPLLGAMFFLPAGTLNYWEAWIYLILLMSAALLLTRYLLKNDPALLERRMRMREKAGDQKVIVKFSYFYFTAIFLLPGFDKRFGWSDAPVWVVLAALVLALTGYLIVIRVFRENSYASRIVEVEDEQKVIETGPYAVVRHPMYSGVTLLYIMTPLALGSYWSMIPALLIIPLLVARILSEEKILANDLDGYSDYQKKVEYRLIPFVW